MALDLVFVKASGSRLSEPHDIVLSPDQHYLYVADNGNDRIVVLDPVSLNPIGTFAEGEVRSPHDVAFDSDGRLLVADTGNNRIAIYETVKAEGRLIGELRGGISRPEGVVAHPNGRIYATGASSGNIVAFENGIPIFEQKGLSAPHDVTVATDGTLWLADAGNDRLVNLTQELAFIKAIGGEPYRFNGPRYLDFDYAGRLYVADKYTHSIKILAPDDKLELVLGNGHGGTGAGKFDRPEGVTIRGDSAWFADTYNDRIVRYRIVE